MRSAREIADDILDPEDNTMEYVEHLALAASAIQDAREDGARWMLEEIKALKGIQPMSAFDPHHVRGVAP